MDIGEEPGAVKVLRKPGPVGIPGPGVAKRLNRRYVLNVLKIETIMKKFLLMIALLGILGFSSQANAGVHVSVGIGVGGGYYGGPYYGYPYYGYPAAYYYGGPAVYYGPGYYPWYRGYWGGGYYRGGYNRGGYYGRGYRGAYSHH